MNVKLIRCRVWAAAFDNERRFQEWREQYGAAMEAAGGAPLPDAEAFQLRREAEALLAVLLAVLRGGVFETVLAAQQASRGSYVCGQTTESWTFMYVLSHRIKVLLALLGVLRNGAFEAVLAAQQTSQDGFGQKSCYCLCTPRLCSSVCGGRALQDHSSGGFRAPCAQENRCPNLQDAGQPVQSGLSPASLFVVRSQRSLPVRLQDEETAWMW